MKLCPVLISIGQSASLAGTKALGVDFRCGLLQKLQLSLELLKLRKRKEERILFPYSSLGFKPAAFKRKCRLGVAFSLLKVVFESFKLPSMYQPSVSSLRLLFNLIASIFWVDSLVSNHNLCVSECFTFDNLVLSHFPSFR